MDDAVTVALKFTAADRRRLAPRATARVMRGDSVGRKIMHVQPKRQARSVTPCNGTSDVRNAEPIARNRIKRIFPPSTFLSIPMSSM